MLSLTGILISTCISVINTLGVYWQHHQWKVPESNRPHGLLVHLTVIAPRDIPFHNRQRTFIVLFPHFLSRQCFHHKKNIIYYTKTRQSYHINNILQRMGKRGIEPPTFTTWERIYSALQHHQSLPLPRNRHKTVSNNVFRAMRCTRHTKCRLQPNHRPPASKQHNLTA